MAQPAARANALIGAAISHGPSALDRALSFEESGSPAGARGCYENNRVKREAWGS